MSRCPADCVFPEVSSSRMTLWDIPRLLLFQAPYRCHSCGNRFYKTNRAVAYTLLVLVGLIAYPLSYRFGAQFEQNPTVKTFYQPLHWVEQQLVTGTAGPIDDSI